MSRKTSQQIAEEFAATIGVELEFEAYGDVILWVYGYKGHMHIDGEVGTHNDAIHFDNTIPAMWKRATEVMHHMAPCDLECDCYTES